MKKFFLIVVSMFTTLCLYAQNIGNLEDTIKWQQQLIDEGVLSRKNELLEQISRYKEVMEYKDSVINTLQADNARLDSLFSFENMSDILVFDNIPPLESQPECLMSFWDIVKRISDLRSPIFQIEQKIQGLISNFGENDETKALIRSNDDIMLSLYDVKDKIEVIDGIFEAFENYHLPNPLSKKQMEYYNSLKNERFEKLKNQVL